VVVVTQCPLAVTLFTQSYYKIRRKWRSKEKTKSEENAILAHQDILGGWRVGLTNSSPVLNSEEERGRAPD
jgi:hypothetical protein